MSIYLTHRGRLINPEERWTPPTESAFIHHPLLRDGGVPTSSWNEARVQISRLDALAAEGFRYRSANRTDRDFIDLAFNAFRSESFDRAFDHLFYLRTDDRHVVVSHTYITNEETVRRSVLRVLEYVRTRWNWHDSDFVIRPEFNFYTPGCGLAFSLDRSPRARARQWRGR
jgi:hypothetical protein